MAICGIFLVLLFSIRHTLPVFSDSWYHLGVIRAFSENGFTLHAWWEYAPFGRPQLYSPLFHLVLTGVRKLTGCGLLALAQAYDVVTFPLVLLAGWAAARCLFNERAAFLTLLLLALNIGLVFPVSLIMMPGTYAVLLWPFVFVLLVRNRAVAAGILLATIGWLHFGVGSLALVSLVVFLCFRREMFRSALVAGGLGVILFSPWLIHLFRHREFLQSGVARLPVFIPAFTLVAAIFGLVEVLRRRDREALAVLSIILATGLFLFTLQERFWTYSGFFFALLGGYGVSRYGRVAVVVLAVSCVSATPFLQPARMKLAIPVPFANATPLVTFVCWPRAARAVPEDLEKVAQWVEGNVPVNEVVITEDPLVGSALFVLTGRPTTSGLWTEVRTEELTERLTAYRREARGLIVLNRARTEPGSEPVLAEFGRYAVLRRP